jgi:hypothetical protein
MKLLPLLAAVLTISCFENEQCTSGTIHTNTLPKAKSTTVQPDEQQIPQDFEYTKDHILTSIIGTWATPEYDTILSIVFDEESHINYTIAGNSSKCGPTRTQLYFTCLTKDIPTGSFFGNVTFYKSIDSGEVTFTINGVPYMLRYMNSLSDSSKSMVLLSDIPDLNLLRNDSLLLADK